MGSNKLISNSEKSEIIVPFLKWAGGKRWLVRNHPELFPVISANYIEPFLGSGAVFFSFAPQVGVLSDSNIELIEAYQAIKDDWRGVEKKLKYHNASHDDDYYYRVRESKPRVATSKAARFIYLNRTCWNGLYRVNLKGKFNVPRGTKNKVILDTDDFESTARLLNSATLISGDFTEAFKFVGRDDFVFVDPPYTINHNVNGFVKYNEKLFSWEDQVRLRDCVVCAKKKGAKVLVTNAYHSSVRKLYKGVGTIKSLKRASVISGGNNGRGHYEEMVIKCY